GSTTITNGTLMLGVANAVAGAIIFNGNTATLDLGGYAISLNSITSSVAGYGVITNNGASNVILTIGSDNSSLSISANIQDGSKTIALTKSGTGILTLSGNNSFSGLTTVNGGTLKLGSTTGLSNNSEILFTGASAALDMNGFSETAGSIASTGGNGIITNSSTATNSVLSVSTDNTSTTFSGTLKDGTGTGFKTIGLTKVGTGTLTLSGANTYTGTTTVNAGILSVASVSSPITLNGGTLQYTGATTSTSNVITLAGTSTIDVSNSNSVLTLTSALGFTGSAGLIKEGAGTLVLGAANTYTGTTTVNTGALKLGVTGAIKSTNSIVVSGGTLDLNHLNLTIGSLSLSGDTNSSVISTGGSATITASSNYNVAMTNSAIAT
ncbi:beta strand repeat-containing protein, partial [Polynucleobacter asymbioticus]|uniref:beta strand repeat-containing protein n=1 Tax=Polynucleobacter asymbioticus TaxID=576611 RepID=UPI0016711868